jgi:hypothetical protein
MALFFIFVHLVDVLFRHLHPGRGVFFFGSAGFWHPTESLDAYEMVKDYGIGIVDINGSDRQPQGFWG